MRNQKMKRLHFLLIREKTVVLSPSSPLSAQWGAGCGLGHPASVKSLFWAVCGGSCSYPLCKPMFLIFWEMFFMKVWIQGCFLVKNVRVEKFPLSLNVFSHVLPVPVQVMLVYLVVAYVNYRLQSLLQVPSRQISGRKKKVIVKLFLLGIAGTSFLGVLWCVFFFFWLMPLFIFSCIPAAIWVEETVRNLPQWLKQEGLWFEHIWWTELLW